MTDDSTGSASRLAVGVDIGGTGTKAGLVDLDTGAMVDRRFRLDTPPGADARAVVDTVGEVLTGLAHQAAEAGVLNSPEDLHSLPVGAAFPGVVKQGTVTFAGNLTAAVGAPIVDMLSEAAGRRVHIANDADAAGVAEMTYGAGRKHRKASVIVTTLGTGIGSALFTSGRLYPYTELGHLLMDGVAAERRMSVAAMRRLGLSYEEWGAQLTVYYRELEKLFNPDLFILGGGISKRSADFLSHIQVETPIKVAKLLNNSGIVGAGLLAQHEGKLKVSRK